MQDFRSLVDFYSSFTSLTDDHEEMPDEEEVAPPEVAISLEPKPSDSAEPEGKTFSLFSVPDFFIAQFPVTLAEWEYVRLWGESHGYELPIGRSSGPNCPVTMVDIYEMIIWCNARSEMAGLESEYLVGGLIYRSKNQPGAMVPKAAWSNGFRLPSEQEWEWAARGGVHARTYRSEIYRYAGSDDVNRVAASGRGPQPVGTKEPNELGLYDMSGNVWEVVWSLRNTFFVYPRIRGGSFGGPEDCTITYRELEPHGREPNEGFRVARDIG